MLEANASRYHGVPPGEITWTDAQKQKRAVAENLDALDAEAKKQAQAESDNDSGPDGNGAERQPPDREAPKVISPSDPESAWTAKANKCVQFGYGLNHLIDAEHAVIVDVEAGCRYFCPTAKTWVQSRASMQRKMEE